MKNIPGWLVGIVIFLVFSFGARSLFGGGSVNSQIEKVCAEMRPRLPMMVDEITRLDAVEAADKEIIYLYTLIGVEDSFLNDVTKAELEASVRTQVGNAPEMDSLRKHHVDMSYAYRSGEGKELFRFTIDH